jgi:ureidoglycolate lyase
MNESILQPLPITAERFAPFGEVIESSNARKLSMNDARFDRFDDLARTDIDGPISISIVRSRTATSLPYRVDMLERHPLGSQAFVPLTRFEFVVVVAPPAESVEADEIRAFSVPAGRGINYHRGTWHMPLIALGEAQEFLVIDRAGDEQNCEEFFLENPLMLQGPVAHE